jgi:hypothetical protein
MYRFGAAVSKRKSKESEDYFKFGKWQAMVDVPTPLELRCKTNLNGKEITHVMMTRDGMVAPSLYGDGALCLYCVVKIRIGEGEELEAFATFEVY